MYVPGKIANGKSVIIDIGTGYFVEKVGDVPRRTYK
jgi:prefoldin subunit 5